MKFVWKILTFCGLSFAMFINTLIVIVNQGVNLAVSWSKMLHILDNFLHKFQLV